MDTTSLAPAMPERPVPKSRASRALKLYIDHFEEIALSFRAGVYRVPSCTGEAVYTVRLVPEPYCSCPDFRGGECKHVMAVRVVRKKTAPCAGCRSRFCHREMFEVGDDHLTFFEGDLLCGECAGNHGVL